MRLDLGCARLALKIVAGAVVEAAGGASERFRKGVQPCGGRSVDALLEQRGGNPYGGGEWRQRGHQKDEDQPVAKAVHPFRDPRPAMRGRSARRTRVSSGPQCVTSVFLPPSKSIRSLMLIPIFLSSPQSRAVPLPSSTPRQ